MSDVAPDGSPVEFYAELPAEGEPELIHTLLPPGAAVLDLGCGPGRLGVPLAHAGHAVTGVDNGAAMIAALPPEVEGIVGDARTIRLGRTFDAVLLASHLVNDPEGGRDFAATAAAHLAPGGLVIGETYPPGWDPAASVGRVRPIGAAWVELVRADLAGDLVDAEVRYGVGDRTWSQQFTARLMDEPALRALLGSTGLAFEGWLERPGWFTARRTG